MRLLRLAFCLLAVVVLLAGTSVPSWAASADDQRGAYLALGDSVVFGYIADAGYAYVSPSNFIGNPAYTGDALGLRMADAGCPGETSSGFLSINGADHGCRAYRAHFPLHVPYSSTQMDYATAFLNTHPHTRLITIGIGANDLFLLEDQCAGDPQCLAAGFPQALATLGTNLSAILAGLRSTGYRGVIIVTNYYSPDYTDPNLTGQVQALNQTLAAAAATQHAFVADVFTAFQQAAANPFAGGQTCKAGLLNASSQNQLVCDQHPSQSGQQLIALTVLRTYWAAVRSK